MLEPKKKHILFFVPTIERGGMGNAIRVLAAGFRRRGWQVTLLTLQPIEDVSGDLPDIRIISLSKRRTSGAVGALFRTLRASKPDVVISASIQLNLMAVIARLACPSAKLILTERTNLQWLMNVAPSAKLRLVSRGRKLLYRFADHVVANSRATAEDLRSIGAVPPARLSVIYNAVLTEELKAGAAKPPTHPWLAEKSGEVVVALGHLIEPKAFDILVQAFALVVARRPEARLVIFGEGNQRDSLQRLIAELGLDKVVSLPGEVRNQYAEIAAADLLVSASRVETFGLTLAEALCLNVPVVAAKAEGGVAEILDDGRFGQLVPLDDPGALAEAMVTALTEQRSGVDEEAASRFSEDAVLDRWEELLDHVCASSEPAQPAAAPIGNRSVVKRH